MLYREPPGCVSANFLLFNFWSALALFRRWQCITAFMLFGQHSASPSLVTARVRLNSKSENQLELLPDPAAFVTFDRRLSLYTLVLYKVSRAEGFCWIGLITYYWHWNWNDEAELDPLLHAIGEGLWDSRILVRIRQDPSKLMEAKIIWGQCFIVYVCFP